MGCCLPNSNYPGGPWCLSAQDRSRRNRTLLGSPNQERHLVGASLGIGCVMVPFWCPVPGCSNSWLCQEPHPYLSRYEELRNGSGVVLKLRIPSSNPHHSRFSPPQIEKDMEDFCRGPTPESRPPWIPDLLGAGGGGPMHEELKDVRSASERLAPPGKIP